MNTISLDLAKRIAGMNLEITDVQRKILSEVSSGVRHWRFCGRFAMSSKQRKLLTSYLDRLYERTLEERIRERGK